MSSKELDQITLERAKRGDNSASQRLVEHYQGAVWALLSRVLTPQGRQSQVADLAQECFLRVFSALPRFQVAGSAKLSTWILTIASRLAIDELRRRPLHLSMATDMDSSADASPLELVDRRQLQQSVRHAIAQLEPEYRVALALRVFHDMSYGEIAQALEIEMGTVKSRLARARSQIRDLLLEDGHDA